MKVCPLPFPQVQTASVDCIHFARYFSTLPANPVDSYSDAHVPQMPYSNWVEGSPRMGRIPLIEFLLEQRVG